MEREKISEKFSLYEQSLLMFLPVLWVPPEQLLLVRLRLLLVELVLSLYLLTLQLRRLSLLMQSWHCYLSLPPIIIQLFKLLLQHLEETKSPRPGHPKLALQPCLPSLSRHPHLP